MSERVLDIQNLVVEYPGQGFRAKPFRVLHSVSVDLYEGECVGLVGESGCGKTTLGRAVLGLAPVTGGQILYRGEDIAHWSRAERRRLAGDIQVVFQDPYTSLNPSLTVEQILIEPLRVQKVPRDKALKRIKDLFEFVQLPRDAGSRLPREFSGGQRQRIAIARALALEPKLVICDEPVSALDLSTQRRVLDLFLEIQERTNVAMIFISHDLEVVRYVSHRVAVMYAGEIVEFGDGDQVTSRPEHLYTKRLFFASPVADPDEQARRRKQRLEFAAHADLELAGVG